MSFHIRRYQPRRSRLIRYSIVGVILMIAGASWYLLVQSSHRVSSPKASTPTSVKTPTSPKQHQTTSIPAHQPARLIIDKIGVDAPINPVGLEADGAMAAPTTLTDIGWYNKSASFGAKDHAMLLDGHYGQDSAPGIFYHLHKMRTGDTIKIKSGDGRTAVFTITKTEQTARQDVDMEQAYNYGAPHDEGLTMITCEGEYDAANDTYDDRFVVFAKRTQ